VTALEPHQLLTISKN